jgi:hypothetical protein
MVLKISDFWRGYVKGLSEAGLSAYIIVQKCKKQGLTISKASICSIIAELKKNPPKPKFEVQKVSRCAPQPKRTSSVISKIQNLAKQENPPTQRAMAEKVGTSSATVNRIIRSNLKLRKCHKARVHALNERHIAERKTNCRKLYECYLSNEKWKMVVTLDEAWIYLSDCGKARAICYRPQGEKGRSDWVRSCRESFPKGFMVVAGYCSRGRLPIRKIHPNAKINSAYYQKNILEPIYRHDIPYLYGEDKNRVFIHQDKAPSHTSRATTQYCQQMELETGIRTIPFSDIPVKSPDASPMDFCGFGLLKRGLGNRRPKTLNGLWKVCEEVWNTIPLHILQRSLLQWKLRCRAIVRMQGKQIEHNRWWRNGFS